jgi:predicted transcriptional regulator
MSEDMNDGELIEKSRETLALIRKRLAMSDSELKDAMIADIEETFGDEEKIKLARDALEQVAKSLEESIRLYDGFDKLTKGLKGLLETDEFKGMEGYFCAPKSTDEKS